MTTTVRSAVRPSYMRFLNQTIDHGERLSSLENRSPRSVWLLLFSVSAIAVFTRGLTLAGHLWRTPVLAP